MPASHDPRLKIRKSFLIFIYYYYLKTSHAHIAEASHVSPRACYSEARGCALGWIAIGKKNSSTGTRLRLFNLQRKILCLEGRAGCIPVSTQTTHSLNDSLYIVAGRRAISQIGRKDEWGKQENNRLTLFLLFLKELMILLCVCVCIYKGQKTYIL